METHLGPKIQSPLKTCKFSGIILTIPEEWKGRSAKLNSTNGKNASDTERQADDTF